MEEGLVKDVALLYLTNSFLQRITWVHIMGIVGLACTVCEGAYIRPHNRQENGRFNVALQYVP